MATVNAPLLGQVREPLRFDPTAGNSWGAAGSPSQDADPDVVATVLTEQFGNMVIAVQLRPSRDSLGDQAHAAKSVRHVTAELPAVLERRDRIGGGRYDLAIRRRRRSVRLRTAIGYKCGTALLLVPRATCRAPCLTPHRGCRCRSYML